MKIKIELQGRELELTVDEARSVFYQLRPLFENNQQINIPFIQSFPSVSHPHPFQFPLQTTCVISANPQTPRFGTLT
jgi:hypothetical protein